jgi:hypothetical protein
MQFISPLFANTLPVFLVVLLFAMCKISAKYLPYHRYQFCYLPIKEDNKLTVLSCGFFFCVSFVCQFKLNFIWFFLIRNKWSSAS